MFDTTFIHRTAKIGFFVDVWCNQQEYLKSIRFKTQITGSATLNDTVNKKKEINT